MPKAKRAKKTVKRKKAGAAINSDSHGGNHSVLREALRDIAKELSQLREEKNDLEMTLDNIAGDITSTQNKEVDLKDQLRKLSSVENSLSLKRARMRKNLEQVKQKIGKVRQLSSQMENL